MKIYALIIILSVALVGCANHPALPPKEATKQLPSPDELTADAAGAIMRWLRAGDLPGFAKDAHGDLQNVLCDCDVLFPTTRTFYLTKQGETTPYNYTLFRESINSQWQLQRAWITNSTTHVVEELSR